MNGVVITTDLYRRLVRFLNWGERQMGMSTGVAQPPQGVEPMYARVDDGTPDGDGYYAATLGLSAGGEMQEYSEVLVQPLNEEALQEGVWYPVRAAGRTGGGDELYAVAMGGLHSLEVRKLGHFGTVPHVLEFDPDSGFDVDATTIDDVITSTVTMVGASGGQRGVVTDENQSWWGIKSLDAIILSGDDSIVAGQLVQAVVSIQASGPYCWRTPTSSAYGDDKGAEFTQQLAAGTSATGTGLGFRQGKIWVHKWTADDEPDEPQIEIGDGEGGWAVAQTDAEGTNTGGLIFHAGWYCGGSLDVSDEIDDALDAEGGITGTFP